MYVTRDLDNAKQYVRERYQEQHDKRFGLLASSKAKNLPKYGIQNDWSFTKNLREGPWYNVRPVQSSPAANSTMLPPSSLLKVSNSISPSFPGEAI